MPIFIILIILALAVSAYHAVGDFLPWEKTEEVKTEEILEQAIPSPIVQTPQYYYEAQPQEKEKVEEVEKLSVHTPVKITITNVKLPTVTTPSLITLRASDTGEPINITGWEFKSEKGSFFIPRGIEYFDPRDKERSLKDIIIKSGDIIYISTLANPLGPRNWSFRPNKCMGYLASSREFAISLPGRCPTLTEKDIPVHLDRCCKEYIKTLGRCEAPKYEGMKAYDLFKNYQCMNFLNTISYGGCYLRHSEDPGFTSNEWHIYLDRERNEILDKEAGTLYIYDQDGLLVTAYDYGPLIPCCK